MHGCWETLEARLEAVTSPPSPAGDLSLGHILQAAGLADLGEVIVLGQSGSLPNCKHAPAPLSRSQPWVHLPSCRSDPPLFA